MWWMVYVENYFPYMYGLFELECASKRYKKEYFLLEMKKEFKRQYIEYCKRSNIFYIQKELNKIMDFHIEKEYGRILLIRFKMYRNNQTVKDVLEIVNEICQNKGVTM